MKREKGKRMSRFFVSICVVIFYVLIVISSCARSIPARDSGRIGIPVYLMSKSESDPVVFDDIFESVSIVRMDTAEMVGRIGRICVVDDRIFIADYSTSSIVVFDTTGRYVSKINRKGRGPEEYVSLSTFDVNRKTGDISVLDVNSRKVVRYSSKHIFRTEVTLANLDGKEQIPRDMAVLDNGDYVFYTPDFMKKAKNGIWQIDSSGIFKYDIYTMSNSYKFNPGLLDVYFSHYRDSVVLAGSDEYDNVYHIGCDSWEVPYGFLMDMEIPEYLRKREEGITGLDMDVVKEKYYFKPMYFETDEMVFSLISNVKKTAFVFYDKKSGKTSQYNYGDAIQKEMHYPFPTMIQACDGSSLYMFLLDEIPGKSQFLEGIKDDTPIFVKYKTK